MKFIKDNLSGSYYSLENDALIQWPMNLDGSRDQNTSCEVDWLFVYDEMPILYKGKEFNVYKHLKDIETKLMEGGKKCQMKTQSL